VNEQDEKRIFWREIAADPFKYMQMKLWVDAFALGYEQALRDNHLDDVRLREGHAERLRRGHEMLVSREAEAERNAMIAMSVIATDTNLIPKGPMS
jgi:hypothetical protein